MRYYWCSIIFTLPCGYMNCYIWIFLKIKWCLPKTHSAGWKEIQFLPYFLTSILSRVTPERLRWAPCFPPTSITSRCSLSKPSGLALLLPYQVWAWGAWPRLGAEDLVSGFLGLTCMVFFLTSYKFPGACQGNKVVLFTVGRTHQNISLWSWGIMLFSGSFAFTSTYSLNSSPQPLHCSSVNL